MKDTTSTLFRPFCYRCMKPKVTCICEGLVKVPNRTGLHIVQHMRERGHSIGTARIAALGLNRVFVETIFPSDGLFRSEHVFPPGTALLYPGKNPLHLEQIPVSARPLHLAVIDGTWQQASKIYRDSPNLCALPCVTFREVLPSNYRIRLEPCEAANATIEAICRALKILEPDTPGVDGLLLCFDKMIDEQLSRAKTGDGRSVLKLKTYKKKNVSRYLQDEKARVVVACGERVLGDLTTRRGVLWTWNALRLNDNAAFSAVLAPVPPLSEPKEQGLCAGGHPMSKGLTHREFRDAWHAYIRPEDVIVTWGNKAMGRLFDVAGPHPHFIFLKAAYGNLHRGTCAVLDELTVKENLKLAMRRHWAFAPNVADYLAKMAAAVAFIGKTDADRLV